MSAFSQKEYEYILYNCIRTNDPFLKIKLTELYQEFLIDSLTKHEKFFSKCVDFEKNYPEIVGNATFEILNAEIILIGAMDLKNEDRINKIEADLKELKNKLKNLKINKQVCFKKKARNIKSIRFIRELIK